MHSWDALTGDSKGGNWALAFRAFWRRALALTAITECILLASTSWHNSAGRHGPQHQRQLIAQLQPLSCTPRRCLVVTTNCYLIFTRTQLTAEHLVVAVSFGWAVSTFLILRTHTGDAPLLLVSSRVLEAPCSLLSRLKGAITSKIKHAIKLKQVLQCKTCTIVAALISILF